MSHPVRRRANDDRVKVVREFLRSFQTLSSSCRASRPDSCLLLAAIVGFYDMLGAQGGKMIGAVSVIDYGILCKRVNVGLK